MKRPSLPRRRSSIARTAITGKRARIRRNAKRQAKNHERAYGSAERIRWVAASACVVCGLVGHSDNAHVVTGGTSRKADARWIVPLCAGPKGCHAELHRIGIKSFQQRYGVDLRALAAETDHRYTLEHAA